jgi:DNA-binding NtrC family response regulator
VLNVLIVGETGTGKELVAQSIHALSPRRRKTLISYNCAGTSTDLVASELFGHLQGAFTGASQNRIGLLEEAHGSHLLLDELEAMPVDHQVKLLRIVEDGRLRPVGGREKDTRVVAVRYLAATNRDPYRLVVEDKLREDLYYRLSGHVIVLPPLRDRAEDIPLLTRHFLAGDAGALTEEALRALQTYHWPGNVRQLENTLLNARGAASYRGNELIQEEDIATLCNQQLEMGRGVARSDGPHVKAASDKQVPCGKRNSGSNGSVVPDLESESSEYVIRRGTLAQIEHEIVLQTLKATGGNVSAAARTLNIERTTLRRILRAAGMAGDRGRGSS